MAHEDFQRFWMVRGSGDPTYHHPTKQSAMTEAERLCRAHPGNQFFVLESVAMVKKCDVRWVFPENTPESEMQIPF
jgi:hypothetical protein